MSGTGTWNDTGNDSRDGSNTNMFCLYRNVLAQTVARQELSGPVPVPVVIPVPGIRHVH